MKKLFIISGGPGREHEVSLSSGKNVVESLQEASIPYESITVTKEKKWRYHDSEMTEEEALTMLKNSNALLFSCIHGTYGEDGELANLLEKNDISCIGSSRYILEVTIDKYKTEKLLEKHGVHVPRSFVVSEGDLLSDMQMSFPVIVKPQSEGSSVALYKVATQEELEDVLVHTIPLYKNMVVQEYISGREFTCGVVEIGGIVTSLLPSEIILTKGHMFDYEAKYTIGGCREITPAEVDGKCTAMIQDLAKKVHVTCGCKDISRTDMIMKEDGELIVLEINTIPGMTKTSFIPAQLKASGYTLEEFIKGMMKKYE